MKLSKIRELAPEDATHYSDINKRVCYYQVEDGVALYMCYEDVPWFDCTDADFSDDLECGEIKPL